MELEGDWGKGDGRDAAGSLRPGGVAELPGPLEGIRGVVVESFIRQMNATTPELLTER